MKANVRPTILLILLLIAIACSPAGFYPAVVPPAVLSQATAEERRTEEQPLQEQGSLVIIGGGLQYTQNDVWSRIVELAGGEGAKIAVFPTASSDPASNGSRTIEALRAAGGDAFLVPVRLIGGEVDYRKAVTDPELIDAVKTAGGVYFVGGSQERITQALGSSEGNRTPMLDAIWDLYRRGGVVAGSSAGAAVMSRTMYRYSRGVLSTLEDGVQMGRELAPGLGFLHPDWFVEQHCLARGRFGRALVAMQTMGLKYGVGVDENTAVVVRNGRDMSVIGAKGAIVMDLSQATCDPAASGFNLKNARLSYLDPGDCFDLETLELTPSAEKRANQPIDLTAVSTQSTQSGRLVEPNILGNNTLVDLLGKLLENRANEAIGLAFDADRALTQTTAGFEFRFYRQDDSQGWFASTGAPTVSNIHLDIRKIEIAGPLYK